MKLLNSETKLIKVNGIVLNLFYTFKSYKYSHCTDENTLGSKLTGVLIKLYCRQSNMKHCSHEKRAKNIDLKLPIVNPGTLTNEYFKKG